MQRKRQKTIADIKPGTTWLHKKPWHHDTASFPKMMVVLEASVRSDDMYDKAGDSLIAIWYISSEDGMKKFFLAPSSEFFPYYYEI